ncbi:antigen WC1.1-like [Argopecten irradians]|uniref:antigen WC1.1-like n=1 Tax=Argopecten irradians TaxID=31199 RepID=UPI0037194233
MDQTNMLLLKTILILQLHNLLTAGNATEQQKRRSISSGFQGILRLVNGSMPSKGRVEIYHDSQWGTICDDHFGYDEARAVCKALGFSYGTPYLHAKFGRGTGPVFVSDLRCSFLSSGRYSLHLGKKKCYFKGWGVSNCYHGQDVGVECIACHCRVPGCNLKTGECHIAGCLPGWMGSTCSEICPPRHFGNSCSSTCHCGSGTGCTYDDGICVFSSLGCEPGWTGVRCDKAIITKVHNSIDGYKAAVSVLAVLLTLAAIIIICVCVKYRRIKKENGNPLTGDNNGNSNNNRQLFTVALPGQRGMLGGSRNGRGNANVAFYGAQVDINLGGISRDQRHNQNNRS